MKTLKLLRTYQEKVTTGVFIVLDDGLPIFSCISLELPWRDNKPQVSCVPEGEYQIKYEYSNKFKQFLWELKGVPDRSEIKIHPANNVHELLGCIALGRNLALKSALVSSRPSVNQFHRVMENLVLSNILITKF